MRLDVPTPDARTVATRGGQVALLAAAVSFVLHPVVRVLAVDLRKAGALTPHRAPAR